jgi:hypothetical protein
VLLTCQQKEADAVGQLGIWLWGHVSMLACWLADPTDGVLMQTIHACARGG